MSAWIEERFKEGLSFRLALKRRCFERRSPFQNIEIFESTHHGKVLLNEGCFMLSERDERIYHEMMAHVPLAVHPGARRVLIVGGGDGGTAREVLRHQSVERCVLVEIDGLVVEACREHLPSTAAVFSDPRLELRVEDGLVFMRDCREIFDLILIDSTDPSGAAQALFGAGFYLDLRPRLAPDGILIAQGESVFYESEMQRNLLRIASPAFDFTTMYNFTNMTYPGGLWSFMWASSRRHPLRDLQPLNGLEMFYYNEEIHRAAFHLPEFQRQALKPWTKI